MSYSFEIHTYLSPTSPLVEQWKTLQTSCVDRNFYHDWRWHCALKTHLIPTMQWIAAYHKKTLIAVIPFEFNEARGIIQLPSHSQIDLFDITLCKQHLNNNWLSELLNFFSSEFKRWKLLSVCPVLESSAVYQMFELHNGLKHDDAFLSNSFFNVSDSKALVKLSKKHLKNINRLSRKLTKDIAEPTFEHACQLPEGLDAFLNIENSSWKGQQGTNSSVLHSNALTAFYKQVAEAFNETNDCFISLGRVNNAYIAGQFALRSGNRLSMVKIGYDANYHTYAPGNILMAETLAYVAHTPVTEVNLVTGPNWAERWHPQHQSVHWVSFYNTTFSSLRAFWWAHTKDKIRPIISKLKPKVDS